MKYSRKNKNYKIKRKLRKILSKEVLWSIFVGSLVFICCIPFLSYFIVSYKRPLEIKDWRELDEVYINVSDKKGNNVSVLEFNELKKELDSQGVEYKTFSFNEEVSADVVTKIEDFCSQLKKNTQIGLVTFEYLLPYLAYDCSQEGMVVYGKSFSETNVENFSFWESLILSIKLFTKII
ncbi:MAG: hypothetical protein KatS3mg085_079 [Candidatus Dojkabacteria bacterium]|nr:MAG: hypothetical protein KatS3mg085_079 [Candidatus Dojkabacteria bacterium]